VVLATSVAAAIPRATGGGLDLLEHLGDAQRAALSGQLSEAFASTFVWILALIVVALIPAATLALGRRRGCGGEGEVEALTAES